MLGKFKIFPMYTLICKSSQFDKYKKEKNCDWIEYHLSFIPLGHQESVLNSNDVRLLI